MDMEQFLKDAAVLNSLTPDPAPAAPLVAAGAGASPSEPEKPAPPLPKPPQDFAIAKDTPAVSAPAPSPAAAPSAGLEQPAASADDELTASAGKRPLAHFGQALPVTKSKANRKLILQLTPEMYQYLAHVSTLPALDAVALPDLVLAILTAWREDYRPEIKRANAAFRA